LGLRIVVTGGSGFIGTNLIEYFISVGADVINLDIAEPRNTDHLPYWQAVDLLDASALNEAIKSFNPDYILHMAARTDLDGRELSDYAANTIGVQNLIAALDGLASLKRVVFASSRLVCRIGYHPLSDQDYCPTTIYGESKVLGENIVRDSACKIPCSWVIVRPTSIWGMWFDVPYKTFFLSIAKGLYVHPGRKQVFKSFGFVGNTVFELQQILHAPVEAVDGKMLYLADYPPINVAEMANCVQRELAVAPVRTVSIALLRVAARTGDLLKMLGWKHPPLTSFRLDNLLTPMVHDMQPLKDIAGDLPHTMEEGVRRTVTWLKSRGEVG